MRSFTEYAAARDRQCLEEGWMDSAKGAIAGVGNLGAQALRGTGNALAGTAQTGLGAVQTGGGMFKGLTGGGWDTLGRGVRNLGQGVGRAAGGVVQAGAAPLSAGVRAYQAGQQQGLGMPTAQPGLVGKAQQFFGLGRAPQPGQQPNPATMPKFNPNQFANQANQLFKGLNGSGQQGILALQNLQAQIQQRLAALQAGSAS